MDATEFAPVRSLVIKICSRLIFEVLQFHAKLLAAAELWKQFVVKFYVGLRRIFADNRLVSKRLVFHSARTVLNKCENNYLQMIVVNNLGTFLTKDNLASLVDIIVNSDNFKIQNMLVKITFLFWFNKNLSLPKFKLARWNRS